MPHLSCSNHHPQSSNYMIGGSQQELPLHNMGSSCISCKRLYLFIYFDLSSSCCCWIIYRRLTQEGSSQTGIYSLLNHKSTSPHTNGSSWNVLFADGRLLSNSFTRFIHQSGVVFARSRCSSLQMNLSESVCLLLLPLVRPVESRSMRCLSQSQHVCAVTGSLPTGIILWDNGVNK